MKLFIEKKKCFHCPAGLFNATFYSLKPWTEEIENDSVRLTMEVHVPGRDDVKMLAARTFPNSLEGDSTLRKFLESWLGEDFFAKHAGTEFDFDTLKGKRGIIQINHRHSQKHKHAFCVLEQILPADSLPLKGSTANNQQQQVKVLAPKFNSDAQESGFQN